MRTTTPPPNRRSVRPQLKNLSRKDYLGLVVESARQNLVNPVRSSKWPPKNVIHKGLVSEDVTICKFDVCLRVAGSIIDKFLRKFKSLEKQEALKGHSLTVDKWLSAAWYQYRSYGDGDDEIKCLFDYDFRNTSQDLAELVDDLAGMLCCDGAVTVGHGGLAVIDKDYTYRTPIDFFVDINYLEIRINAGYSVPLDYVRESVWNPRPTACRYELRDHYNAGNYSVKQPSPSDVRFAKDTSGDYLVFSVDVRNGRTTYWPVQKGSLGGEYRFVGLDKALFSITTDCRNLRNASVKDIQINRGVLYVTVMYDFYSDKYAIIRLNADGVQLVKDFLNGKHGIQIDRLSDFIGSKYMIPIESKDGIGSPDPAWH